MGSTYTIRPERAADAAAVRAVQRRGVGAALVRAGLHACRDTGPTWSWSSATPPTIRASDSSAPGLSA